MGDKPDTHTPSRAGNGRFRGRRVAQALYYLLVAGIATAATVQVTRQVFFVEPPPAAPFTSCRDGLRQLYQAVQRGRHLAENAASDDEETALLRYREAVEPMWRHRDAVLLRCRTDPDGMRLLDALERLRYSEEHGVRHQATELTALRKRVRRLMAGEPDAPSNDETSR